MSDAANGSGVERYGTQRRHGEPLRVLALGALGVVFGDIGTSPLYALKTCMEAAKGVAGDPGTVLGILSLIFWAITLVVTVKYVGLVLRADNRGEGGVLALTALVVNEGKARYPRAARRTRARRLRLLLRRRHDHAGSVRAERH